MDALYTAQQERWFCSGCLLTAVSLEMRLLVNLQRLGQWKSTRQCTDLQGKMFHHQVSPQVSCREEQLPPQQTRTGLLPPSPPSRPHLVTIASISTCAVTSDWPCPQTAAAELASKQWGISCSGAPHFSVQPTDTLLHTKLHGWQEETQKTVQFLLINDLPVQLFANDKKKKVMHIYTHAMHTLTRHPKRSPGQG